MPITHLIDPQVPNYQDLVTKGIYPRTFSKSIWSAGGSVALATAGTDVACTDGTTYFTEIYIPTLRVLTGVFYLIGSVGGTNSVIVTLYDNTGAVLANSLAAGTTVGTAANIQSVAFTSTFTTTYSGQYFYGCTFNGTTAKFRAYVIPGSPFIAGSEAETFGTVTAITPGTTFTADKGPIGGVYGNIA
jgi:hypothetical protein